VDARGWFIGVVKHRDRKRKCAFTRNINCCQRVGWKTENCELRAGNRESGIGDRTHSKANKNQKTKNAKSTSKRKQTEFGPGKAIFHMVMVKALRCTQHNRSRPLFPPGSRRVKICGDDANEMAITLKLTLTPRMTPPIFA